MEKKTKSRKVMQIVVAVMVTLALWVYMEVYVSPESIVDVKDIPVEFTNEDTTLAENGLMLLSGYDTTVDLKLEGTRKVLMQLDPSKVRVVADTSSITTAGVQTLKYSVIFPNDFPSKSVTVKYQSLYNITVNVGKLYSKEVPIKTQVNGQVADGYFTGDISIDPTTLTLRAEREDMLNVSYAKVSVNIGGATSTLIKTVEYTLYDYNDVPVYNDNIRASTKLIQVTVPVRTTKVVPLDVDLVGAELMDSVSLDINPRSVTLVGEGSALDEINKVTLDKIYVEDLVPGLNGPYSYTIKLPAGVSTYDGITEAIVTVAVNGTTEDTITVDSINCEGVADGLRAEVSKPLDVSIWGSEDAVHNATAADIHVRVDLSEITEAGEYVLPAVVTASSDSALTIRGSYEVTVVVTKRVLPPDESSTVTAGSGETITGSAQPGGAAR